jgi:small subunit ribosomal protein S9
MADETILATGRRKSSVARVRVHRGAGVVKINSKELDIYFPVERHRNAVLAPLKATKTLGKYDISAEVSGGGMVGQADAVMLGVARALLKLGGAENEAALRDGGFLTRDSRMKERKKYGRRAARRGFQFSKR